MRFVIADDCIAHIEGIIDCLLEILPENKVYFVGEDGNLKDKTPNKERVSLSTNSKGFMTNLTRALKQNDVDVIILDLALDEYEVKAVEKIVRDYEAEKDYSSEFSHASEIIAKVLTELKPKKIVLISSITVLKKADDLKLFFKEEYRENPKIGFMLTRDILSMDTNFSCEEKFRKMIED